MSCGYICFNCGRCKGEIPKASDPCICVACEHVNPKDATSCEECGMPLLKPAGKPKG